MKRLLFAIISILFLAASVFAVGGGPSTSSIGITAEDITYENLNANGDVGSGAIQVAVGNHAHASYLVNPLTTLGDVIYGGAAGATTRLAGNTTTTKKFLSQTGDGANSAAPSWEVVLDGDLPAALTGKSYNALTLTAAATGFTIAGGTTSKTLTVALDASVAGTNTGDQTLADTTTTLDGTGTAGVATTVSRGDHEHSVTPSGIGAIAATEKAAASGVASLDGSSKVVQDPTNASTTSIANGIPKANASGLIDSAWLDMTPIGSAYTVTNPSTDRAFDVASTTINELAAILGTLITDMNTLTKGDAYVPVTISAGNLSATNSMCLNGYIEITAAGEVELPAGVQGMAVTVRASGAFAVSIDPAGVEVIVLNGAALAGGNKITSTSVANDTATLIHNGTNWIVIGPSVWTDGGA